MDLGENNVSGQIQSFFYCLWGGGRVEMWRKGPAQNIYFSPIATCVLSLSKPLCILFICVFILGQFLSENETKFIQKMVLCFQSVTFHFKDTEIKNLAFSKVFFSLF